MSQFLSEMVREDFLNLRRFRKEMDSSPVFPNIELKGIVTALFFPDSSEKSVKFDRQLRKFYEAVNSGTKRIEVVLVPEANEERGLEGRGQWVQAIHDGGDHGRQGKCAVCKMIRRYKLHQAPYLCLIRPNGDVLYTCAADDVRECFGKRCCCLFGRKERVDGKRAEFTVDYWCWMMGKDAPNWVVVP